MVTLLKAARLPPVQDTSTSKAPKGPLLALSIVWMSLIDRGDRFSQHYFNWPIIALATKIKLDLEAVDNTEMIVLRVSPETNCGILLPS
jgi:hypothetical protein